MGVYIKDMEMPKSCGDCPCGSVFSGYKCMAEQKKFEKYPLDSRQDWCPLVPVQPHGRLIDADALNYTMLYKENWMRGTGVEAPAVWRKDIDAAPTIIPASEVET